MRTHVLLAVLFLGQYLTCCANLPQQDRRPSSIRRVQPFPKAWENDSSVPLCPNSGVTILDDTYPALAQITSSEIDSEFISAILSDEDSKFTPWIAIHESNKDFAELSKNLTAEAKRVVLHAQLQYSNFYENGWIQDFFESFVDTSTGTPVLGLLTDENLGEEDDHTPLEFNSIVKALRSSVTVKAENNYIDWQKYYKTTSDAYDIYAGGDIDAFPGGLCLHGSRQAWENFAENYCKKHENELVLDTSWLEVGHVDEIVSVIPSKISSCGFALGFPSANRALSLLTSSDWSGPTLTQSLAKFKTTQDAVVKASQTAQMEIDKAKGVIQTRLSSIFPKCSIPILDLPVLFATGGDKAGRLLSLTPNLANSVKQGLTYIVQDPVIPSFRTDAESSLQKIGVRKVWWIQQDLNSAHGGVHCASHSVRVCRPRHAAK